jgi:hypothetical protein
MWLQAGRDLALVLDLHAVADLLAAQQIGALERLELAVQEPVGEVRHVLEQHRVVTRAVEPHDRVRPRPRSGELGDVRDVARLGDLGIAGEHEDEAVALAHRYGGDADVGLLAAEQVVRDVGLAVAVVGPAVVRAHELAADDLALGELEVTMGAAVLERAQLAVVAAKHRDRAPEELGLELAAAAQAAALLDRVPVVGVEPGRARLLTAADGLVERGRGARGVPGEVDHRGLRAGRGRARTAEFGRAAAFPPFPRGYYSAAPPMSSDAAHGPGTA